MNPEPYDDDGYRHLSITFPALSEWNALMVWRGSVAHGTYVPNDDPLSIDDKDLIGVCIPPDDYYVGLSSFGSRGTEEIQSDPWDIVVYEHRKALGMLANGNPNMLAMLWTPEDFITDATGAGTALLASKREFSSKRAGKAFLGYAHSQAKKMRANVYQGYMGEKRRALMDKFGYDCKNASHAVRIARQGIEFMETGELEVYRPDADELIDIKRGAYSFKDIKSEIDGLVLELADAVKTSPLPEEPDWHFINELAVDMWALQREGA